MSIATDGNLEFHSKDLEILLELDDWLNHRACAHNGGILLHHRIGNIAMVGLLHTELAREPEKFPVVLRAHAGDSLCLEDIDLLRNELVSLKTFVSSDETTKKYVESFRRKMCELAVASRQVGKPISF